MSNSIIRVLLLEDSPHDVLLLKAALEADPLNTFLLTHAEKLSQGLSLLDRDSFDLILLDLGLPDSQGLEAFERLHQRAPDLPIIILSGNADEQVAILAVQAGAQDYIVKDAAILAILARSIRYAVERQQIQLELRVREKYWRTLIEQSVDAITMVTADGSILYKSPAARHILGYSPEELERLNAFDFVFPEDRAVASQIFAQCLSQPHQPIFSQMRFIRKAGTMCWVEATLTNWLDDPALQAIIINYRDITHRKQTEEALRESEARAQAMLNAIPDLMFRLDRQGVFLDYKADIRDLYAQAEPSLIGRRNRDITPPEFADLIEQKIYAALETGDLQTFEYQLDIPGRGRRDYEARMTPSGSNEVITVARDITERKQVENALRASEEKYRGLLESLDSVIATVDYEGKFLYTNDIAAAQLGCTSEKLIGKNMFELFPEPVATEQLGIIRKAIREDQGHIYEAPSFVHGQPRWYRTFIQPIHDETGRPIYALINSTDIHDLKAAQQELQELNRTLEERVKERTTDLSRANAELARAARAKDEFLANMSHELRTPLNAILGLSEALLEQVRGPLNERQQASVRNIETSGRHLLALISDILDLSKVEAGRLELLIETIPVTDVCQASLLLVKDTTLKKQLQLAFHLNNQLARVQADPKRLKQMLVNLLSNAVKFTPEGGQVSLEVTADAQAGVIRFAVQDSGIGISPEGLARLFQPFTQLDSSLSRQYEGTGLGLALVRRLAELHGGSVTVESDGVPGRGSRFTIALPYHPAPIEVSKRTASEGERKAGAGRLRSALVVEDSESAAEQLARYLQETNVHAIIHSQGDGALEQAVQRQPEVIFLDLLMPDQTGWEVLAQLRADPRTQDIPVIIVSVVDERVKGVAAGAAGYMVKPVSREMLRQTLAAVVAGAESVREALVIVPEAEPVGVRILLAEDNELNIEAFEDYLEDLGYEVVVARNGREALAQAIETQPDLILMDIQMPELDGLQTIRRLRARSEFVTIPIIALTALAMPGDRELCLTAGASEYLTKPIRLKGLVEIIEKLLQQ